MSGGCLVISVPWTQAAAWPRAPVGKPLQLALFGKLPLGLWQNGSCAVFAVYSGDNIVKSLGPCAGTVCRVWAPPGSPHPVLLPASLTPPASYLRPLPCSSVSCASQWGILPGQLLNARPAGEDTAETLTPVQVSTQVTFLAPLCQEF